MELYGSTMLKLSIVCFLIVSIFQTIAGQEIVSRSKPVTMSTGPVGTGWYGQNMVDGNYSTDADDCVCCAGTDRRKNASIEIGLQGTYVISRITVYGRTDKEEMPQSLGDLKILFDDQQVASIPRSSTYISFADFNLTGFQQARTIKFTFTENKNVILCEADVYGCLPGKYADSCSQTCGNCIPNTNCNVISGHCEQCDDGYTNTDPFCNTACEPGQYGRNCSETCGSCRNGTCDIRTGYCDTNKCTDGYVFSDQFCKTECNDGSYGTNCTKQCGKCRDGEVCKKGNGSCTRCMNGYTDTDLTCKTFCKNGTFGDNCSSECGNCKNNSPCIQTTGLCNDCDDGFVIDDYFCNNACVAGQYGKNCSGTCGSCRNGTCNKRTGHCDANECADGYVFSDLFCKTECYNGSYGMNCTYSCGKCRDEEVCNKVNGFCTRCINGYTDTDLTCKTTCEPGKYGFNCTKDCGHCTYGDVCDPSSGHCNNCADGYSPDDPFCDRLCGLGSFGASCGSSCGYCHGNETCNHVNGECTNCITEYTLPLCVVRQNPSSGKDSVSIGVIVGPIISVLIVAGISVIMTVIYRRRLSKNKQGANQDGSGNRLDIAKQPGNVHINNLLQGTSDYNDDENEYYNFNPGRQGITLDNLWGYIYSRKQKGNKHFENEFGLLKDGLVFPHNDALTNPQKNRYKKMFPYDHSRVHLQVEIDGECEFINASFIDGFNTKQKFIASQGPVDAMVVDFWRMVWQQNATRIIMLTNLIETGHEKCIQYWPDEQSVTFERITILLVNESRRKDFLVRTFDIKQDDGAYRRIRQYHFQAWPDKSVPDSTWCLLHFWREVFKDYGDDSAPIIVHCSAGVGRTGTFIALDNLHHQAMVTGRIDPFGEVEKLRNQRVKMVQTLEQYEYLHYAVADSLLLTTHYIWQSQFSDYFDYMIKLDKNKKKPRIKLQFEIIERSVKDLQTPRSNDYVHGNSDITLEIDEYRPMRRRQASTNKSQFPFVTLPGMEGEELFLLGDLPDKTNLADCLNLINEHNVRLVITVPETPESMWSLPEAPLRSFHLEVSRETKGKITTDRNITYMPGRSASKKTFIQIGTFISTTMSTTKKHLDDIFVFIEEVCKKLQTIDRKNRVLVQCSDGEDGYGQVICALLNERMRMKKNGGQINIFETVMLLKRRNRTCIQTYDQYKYLHDVMLHMVENADSAQTPDGSEDTIYQNT